MNERSKLTFDQAQSAFKESRTVETAGQLLKTGLIYWNDDMIGDETFGEECIAPVMRWMTGPFKPY